MNSGVVCSEERVKRVSDARSLRLDGIRQGREKQQVMLQRHNDQLKAEEEAEAAEAAAAAAAAAGGGGDAEEKKAPRVKEEEDRNLVVIIKADVQVCPSLHPPLAALLACHMHQGAISLHISLSPQPSAAANFSAVRLL